MNSLSCSAERCPTADLANTDAQTEKVKPATKAELKPGKVIDERIKVDPSALQVHIEKLTSLQPPRSHRHPGSLDQAAGYIRNQFSHWTKEVEIQEYTVNGKTYKNVIASFSPTFTGNPGAARIVVGAHYDVLGDHPGADDNGTGVAVILELARLFHDLQPALKHRVDFAAYPLEEPPYFRTPFMGSAVHANFLEKSGCEVLLMISVDMVGYFSEETKPHPLAATHTQPGDIRPGFSTSICAKTGDREIVHRFQSLMQEGTGEIKVVPLILPRDTAGLDYSDHLNFWNHGFAGVMLTNYYVCPSPYYHGSEDTVDKINFTKLSYLVRGLYWTLIQL